MIITYPNGTVVKAFLRLRSQDELCVTVAGCDDVLSFTRIEGVWVSAGAEPVTIAPEWQPNWVSYASSEDDHVCATEPSDDLNFRLFSAFESRTAVASTLYLSSLI
jgi:hypothetical protein